MDLSTSSNRLYTTDTSVMEPVYPAFAAPTPINLSRNYPGNTLTPGAIPSPLNFSAITPPSSPYSFYGLYSPASAPRVSPLYDPAYLRRLKSNPMFRDLQSLLVQECQQMQVPASLITTSWNLMELQKTTPTTNMAPPTSTTSARNETKGQHVYMCHMKLQDKLLKVRIDPAISADGLSVENDYSKEVGAIEMDRYRALHSCPSDSVKVTINSYYDKERLNLANKTEEKLDQLIEKAEAIRKAVQKTNSEKTVTSSTNLNCNPTNQQRQTNQPAQSQIQGASLLLQNTDTDKFNAVRQLKFNTSDDNVNANDNDDDDYLNCSVNSEDFEIDEIDVETVDRDMKDGKVTPPTTQTQMLNPSSQNGAIEGLDILKQCIAQSGISSLEESNVANINVVSTDILDHKTFKNEVPASDTVGQFFDTSEDAMYPDSSTLDSPMSVDSEASSSATNPDSSRDCSHGSPVMGIMSTSAYTSDMSTTGTSNIFNNQMYHTPHTTMRAKFVETNNNIDFALAEIHKLCGGSTVSFMPEMRRDTTPAFTPETLPKYSPLGELCDNNVNVNDYRVRDNYITQNNTSAKGKSMWTSPVDTSSWSGGRMGTGQKRKSPCDSETNDTNEAKHMNLNNNNMNSNSESSNNINNNVNSASGQAEFNSERKMPVFKTHKMLTADVTNILSQWYHAHVKYPYPNDKEVQQLSQMTGITDRQVKKWMANKRVRCFNTLSITGNQHPIKYKYQGRKRKPAAQAAESTSADKNKENCGDSTEAEKKANYTMLTDQAKQILNQWYNEHLDNPYPSEEEKQKLVSMCRISLSQVKSWFANKRNRTNNTKRQVPNYFINRFPEYSQMVQFVGQKREEARMIKRRKLNDFMYIQPQFYL